MIDHIRFNQENYYPAAQIAASYANTDLIGKTITYSNYKVGWYKNEETINANNRYAIDISLLQWNIPNEVIDLASTGEIWGVLLDKNHIPYYYVYFPHWIKNHGTGDYVYTIFIKASDIMTRDLSGEQL